MLVGDIYIKTPMSQKKGKIYKITNKVNESTYIGCTINSLDKRMGEHINRCKTTDCNTKLYNSMRKYGFKNFEIELVEECDLKVMYQTEMEYIKKLNTFKKGLNTTLGGEGCLGYVHSPEIREKISLNTKNGNSHLGKTYEELYGENAEIEKEKRRLSVKNSWKTISEEQKEDRIKKLKENVRTNSKYSLELIKEIKNKFKQGFKVKDIKNQYPQIPESYLYTLKNNRRWSDI
jgi:group I intron endonuclease